MSGVLGGDLSKVGRPPVLERLGPSFGENQELHRIAPETNGADGGELYHINARYRSPLLDENARRSPFQERRMQRKIRRPEAVFRGP